MRLLESKIDIACYIECEMNGLVLECSTGDDRTSVVMGNIKSNPPDARQLWHIAEWTGGRCLIHSKLDDKVLTCKDNTVEVCDRLHGDDNTQLWSWDKGNIISASSGCMVGVACDNARLSLYEWDGKQHKEASMKFHTTQVSKYMQRVKLLIKLASIIQNSQSYK